MFLPKWTKNIQNEWARNVLKNHSKVTSDKIDRIQNLMNIAALDALIDENDFIHLIDVISLPDRNDRHVLAAAISIDIDEDMKKIIVTFNLRDFPQSTLSKYKITAISPDDLIEDFCKSDIRKVYSALEKQVGFLKNPPMTKIQVIDVLKKIGLHKTDKYLTDYNKSLMHNDQGL